MLFFPELYCTPLHRSVATSFFLHLICSMIFLWDWSNETILFSWARTVAAKLLPLSLCPSWQLHPMHVAEHKYRVPMHTWPHFAFASSVFVPPDTTTSHLSFQPWSSEHLKPPSCCTWDFCLSLQPWVLLLPLETNSHFRDDVIQEWVLWGKSMLYVWLYHSPLVQLHGVIFCVLLTPVKHHIVLVVKWKLVWCFGTTASQILWHEKFWRCTLAFLTPVCPPSVHHMPNNVSENWQESDLLFAST